MKISQKERYNKAQKQLQRVAQNAENIQETLEWYDEQLKAFKAIEPGCNNARNLEARLKAWKNIVPGYDTPEKLANYIAQIQQGHEPIQVNIDPQLSFFELWNQSYVPYCKKIEKLCYPFANENEYNIEVAAVLNDIKEYGRSNDPLGIINFFKWINKQGISLPANIAVIL